MAKAPRRPGRDRSGRRAKGDDKARPVKPVAPPKAQPVKPVKPVKPAEAAEAVKPVRPAVAKPVQPVAPARAPVAAPVAPPVAPPASQPAGRSRRGAVEEEVGSRRGGRGGAPRSTGMSFPLKMALVAGAATLLILAVAVLLGGGKKNDAEASFNEAGYTAAQALAGTDPRWWAGSSGTKVDGVALARQVVVDLFDVEGREFWDLRAAEVEQPINDEMDLEDRQELQNAKQRWAEASEKYSGAGSKDKAEARRSANSRMQRLVNSKVAGAQDVQIYGAWIREVKSGDVEGDYIASTPTDPSSIAYDWSKARDYVVDGKIGGEPVRIFGCAMDPISAGASRTSLRAYVALWSGGLGGSGSNDSVGLAMLLLGPLLVGGIAYALANAHSKNVKALAREIDRLGTSGDATRTLRAQGAEAATVARSIEKMVGNLEFRSKHGDDDLDVIVEKEREVAEEIHGALMSKNPPRLSDYEVETLFKPGFEIGGDHFEYFRIDDDHLGVILLDTNVRGITAALVMASARSYVRLAAPGVLSPAEVLRTVNRSLAGDLPAGRHVTALYVVIDTREGKATIASAGHLPLIVYRHATGKVAKVNPEGIALGLDVGPIFDRSLQEGDIPIGVGDRIVLYTDGALQVQNTESEEFGEARFYQSVSKEAPKNSQAFVNFVGSAIDQFHMGALQSDDITISTVKRLK